MVTIETGIWRWLNEVVIGLNLCPFSGQPTKENRVRLVVAETVKDEEDILAVLEQEMQLLDQTPARELETTLVAIPHLLADFYDYSQCVQWAEQMIKRNQWRGVYQLATFHPHYCFYGCEPDDAENLTNRAPYPLFHIIREASLEQALHFFPDVDAIPARNRKRVEALTDAEKRALFPYINWK